MSLKQDIIVVNEFSVRTADGGTRGGTPGHYVERYMAREGAVEIVAPIRRSSVDTFVMRYMARDSAVEQMDLTRHQMAQLVEKPQGDGGVAFGYGSVSLSHEQLHAASSDIQKGFDAGKTVLKTVLSFSKEFLARHGVIDPHVEYTKPGDYRGQVDQLKLRLAIMRGLERMGAGRCDDLRYVGVIQVDTENLHCHLAMFDAGPGQLAADGTQRGKLRDRDKSRLRRGIETFLDEKHKVAHLSSAVGYERRNITAYIKRWAYQKMSAETLPQFLIACLPKDRTLWRAGTNNASMRKANEIVTDLVAEQLEAPGSPLPAAMDSVLDYANHRRELEGLTQDEWQRLVDVGRAQIMERAVNAVYQMLRALPQRELRVRTPMLDVMGLDDRQLALLAARQTQTHHASAATRPEDDLISFGFRLRSYGSRLDHHRQRSKVYQDLVRQWEQADTAGVAAAESRALYDFYRVEQRYHEQLMDKYQHFLPVMAQDTQWTAEQRRLIDYGQRILALTALRADTTLPRLKDPAEAERLGREVYDQPGGRFLTEGKAGKAVLDARLAAMQARYDTEVKALASEVAATGHILVPEYVRRQMQKPGAQDTQRAADTHATQTGSGVTPTTPPQPPVAMNFSIEPGERSAFVDVKGLDLHHLGYDFVTDVDISQGVYERFRAACEQRRARLMDAMNYLDKTGQHTAINDLPVRDVAGMTKTLRTLQVQTPDARGHRVLVSQIAQLQAQTQQVGAMQRSATTRLDADLSRRLHYSIDEAVARPVPEVVNEVPRERELSDELSI